MDRRNFLYSMLGVLAACSPPPAGFRNTDLTGASFGRDFDLTDHHGQRQKLANFRDRAVIVSFGYTTCPDVCPTTLARLANVMNALGGEASQVQVLFVTLDPERDTAERLQAFVPWFHPSFIGLRGDAAQTQAVTAEYRVFSSRQAVDGPLGYVIDHSSGCYVYDPAGRLRLYLKDDANVDDIVADLRQLLAG